MDVNCFCNIVSSVTDQCFLKKPVTRTDQMKLRKCRELNAIDVKQLLKKKLELKIRSRDYRGVGQGLCL